MRHEEEQGPYTAEERLPGYEMIRERWPAAAGPYGFDRPPLDDAEAREAFVFICAELGIDVAALGVDRTAEALTFLHDFYVWNDTSPRRLVSDADRVMTYDCITGGWGWCRDVETATSVLRITDQAERRKAARAASRDGFTPPPAARQLAHARLNRECRCLCLDCRCG